MKIYTKQGDKGTTALLGGKLVNKFDVQIEAYGTVDELNSFISLLKDKIHVINHSKLNQFNSFLLQIQNSLFVIGSNLALEDGKNIVIPKIEQADVLEIENKIDQMELILKPMTNFIIPGGNELISLAHVCRTITRRAERRVVELSNLYPNNKDFTLIVIYLNRLSDCFFVLSRTLAHELEVEEILWKGK